MVFSLEPEPDGACVNWEEKISEYVWDKIEVADENEKLPVWIWFADIDPEKVEEQVERTSGLTADNLAVFYGSTPDERIGALEEAAERVRVNPDIDPTGGKLKSFSKPPNRSAGTKREGRAPMSRNGGARHGMRIFPRTVH